MKSKPRNWRLQQQLAYEAARIMVEQHVQDVETARRKAAERLGVSNSRLYPKPMEVAQALVEYQQLFRGQSHARRLNNLRVAAIRAMEALRQFRPRLVGPVLQGTADEGSAIQLHLFADSPEEVALSLMERRMAWRDAERQFVYSDGSRRAQPSFHLRADDTDVELVVFTPVGMRNPPLDPVYQRPMTRGTIDDVRKLLQTKAEHLSGPSAGCW